MVDLGAYHRADRPLSEVGDMVPLIHERRVGSIKIDYLRRPALGGSLPVRSSPWKLSVPQGQRLIMCISKKTS